MIARLLHEQLTRNCTGDLSWSPSNTRYMDRPDDVSDNESEAYLGDDDGNVGPQDEEVADLNGAEAGPHSERLVRYA